MGTTASLSPSGPVKPGLFDKRAFLKYVRDIGRPYRKRAVELVKICRTFVEAQDQEQAFDSYYKLKSVLELVDDALMSVTEAKKKADKKKADEAFENAVNGLSDYERKYHLKPDTETVAERIKKAEEMDKASSKVLNSLMEKFRPLEPEPTFSVEFFIYHSLADMKRTIVKQALCSKSDQHEILWNFRRRKDEKNKGSPLTLQQNPHFYEELPTSRDAYGDNFSMSPIDSIENCLRDNIKRADNNIKIDVLTDNLGQAGRVFIKTSRKGRVFGNVCAPMNALIFKDVQGKLEGESNVSKEIQNTPLWCLSEPPPASRSSRSSTPGSQTPTTTSTSTTSSEAFLLTDWKQIHQMLLSDVNIRISTKLPIKSIPSSPAPSSSGSQSGFGSSIGSRLPTPEPSPAESPPSSPAHPLPEPEPSKPTAVPASVTRVPSGSLARLPPELEPSEFTAVPASVTGVPSGSPARPPPEQPASVTRDPSESPARRLPELEPPELTAVPASITSVPSGSPERSLPELEPSKPTAVPVSVTRVPSGSPASPPPEQPASVTRVPSGSPARPLPRPETSKFTAVPISVTKVLSGSPARSFPEPPLASQLTVPRRKNWFQRHIWDYEK